MWQADLMPASLGSLDGHGRALAIGALEDDAPDGTKRGGDAFSSAN
jgi:hypothetical protein